MRVWMAGDRQMPYEGQTDLNHDGHRRHSTVSAHRLFRWPSFIQVTGFCQSCRGGTSSGFVGIVFVRLVETGSFQ
jgi:hypothetical protein